MDACRTSPLRSKVHVSHSVFNGSLSFSEYCCARKKYLLSETDLEIAPESPGYLKNWFKHISYGKKRNKKVDSVFSPTKVNFNPNFT